jgi:hypothetical protein
MAFDARFPEGNEGNFKSDRELRKLALSDHKVAE